MAYFHYEALTRAGSRITGNIDAPTSTQATRLLREKELFVLKVRGQSEITSVAGIPDRPAAPLQKRVRTFTQEGLNKEIILFKPSEKEWAQVYRQLALTIRSGVTLVESLDLIAKRAPHPTIQHILFDVLENIENGTSLADALLLHRKEVGDSTINLIRCGETSGDIVQVLSDIVDMIAYRLEQRKKVTSALIMPKVISIAMVVMFFIISYRLAPQFRAVLGANLDGMPLVTTSLFAFADFFRSFWPLIAISVAIAWIAGNYWYRTERGKSWTDNMRLKLPLLGSITTQAEMNQAFHTLNLLLKSGLPLVEAVQSISQISRNQYYAHIYIRSCERLLAGDPFSSCLVDKNVPELVPVLVHVGEKTGALEEVSAELGEYFRQELEDKVKALIDRMPIVLTFVMGSLVAWIYGGVMLGLASARL